MSKFVPTSPGRGKDPNLLEGSGPLTIYTTVKEREFLKQCRGLDDDQQKTVLNVINLLKMGKEVSNEATEN